MMQRRSLLRSVSLGLLGVSLLAAIVFVMRSTGPLAPVPVTVATVSEATLSPTLFGIGVVEAQRSYLIGPTGAARVLRVRVDVGDQVEPGQLLAELDPIDLDERLRAIDASLRRAGSTIAAVQAQQADSQARRELAAANLRRYGDLERQGFISSGAMDGKRQELASAEAGVRSAQANLAAARHDRERLQAERAGLLQQRDNTRLLATQGGIVLSREAEPGSTVVAGQAVLRVIDPASLWIRARFDQARSGALAADLAATVVLRSKEEQPLTGRVARVEMQGDSVTEERMAQITVDALPVGTAVGELAEVSVSLPAMPSALVVPNAAIRRVDGRLGAWRLQDDSLQFVELRLGQSSLDGRIQVLDGLASGDQVVVYSAKTLDAGSRIAIRPSLVAQKP
ncbi:efflux RND transporter periplasmic adaptor subunit [Comamonadaceae bacterium G21597-S1]|nr:efflux RND transporter periplasmic adaptor subunit [Comamonadaceae bacterium G21597-S1]